jgi:hypothetical protein
MLEKAGWDVQDIDHLNINAQQGIAIRDFPLKPGHVLQIMFFMLLAKLSELLEQRR